MPSANGRSQILAATVDPTLTALRTIADLYGYDGTNESRALVESAANPNILVGLREAANQLSIAAANGDALAATVLAAASRSLGYVFNGTTWDRVLGTAPADALTQPARGLDVLAFPMTWNSATWDRYQGSQEVALLAGAARTVSTTTATQTTRNLKGLLVKLRIDAQTVGASPTIAIRYQPTTGIDGTISYITSPNFAPSVDIFHAVIMPGAQAIATGTDLQNLQINAARMLSPTWNIQIVYVNNITSITYALAAHLIY